MQLEDIYQFFNSPPPTYLNPELATCYVLSVLLEGDSYGSKLMKSLEQHYPNYRLSDTVLYRCIRSLEQEQVVTAYWQRLEGRGRPRHMYCIIPEKRSQVENLAQLWRLYLDRR
jgi:DNA-binding PadR family transcriptional regulator